MSDGEYRKDGSPLTTARTPRTSYHDDHIFQTYPYYEVMGGSEVWSQPLYTNLAQYSRQGRPSKLYPNLYYPPDQSSNTYLGGVDEEREGDVQNTMGVVTATPHGLISVNLSQYKMRIDITIDKAIRVINFQNNIVMAMNPSGSVCALLHPNGRIYQYGSRVEIMAHDSTTANHKYAKMWYKGVSFTSEKCPLVYLVDLAGTRTTTDKFTELGHDFSLPVFYKESRHGPAFVSEALQHVANHNYWLSDDHHQNMLINGIKITLASDGLLRVTRNMNKYNMRTSASSGSASLTTPFIHCTASLGQSAHLFVRRGERRIHYDGNSFIVRNAGHSAGFDERNQLKVF